MEVITFLSGYRFINTMTYFFLNGLILFILILLINKKLLAKTSIKIFFGLIICFGFLSSTTTYVSHSPNSSSTLIIQENEFFHGYMYTFYTKKFIFFKESLPGDSISSDDRLNINKSVEFIWQDDTTVKLVPINNSFSEEKTISLNNTYNNFTPTF